MTDTCVFCDIVAQRSPSRRRIDYPEVVAFEPLNPVVIGHMLFVPQMHVMDAVEAPLITGMVFARAAEYAAEIGSDVNLITSAGPAATQTVFHLHVHVVPRAYGDGLPLPWTPQQDAESPCQGRCEFHGRLWCKETGRSCQEFMDQFGRSAGGRGSV